jgi:hypothetical protein
MPAGLPGNTSRWSGVGVEAARGRAGPRFESGRRLSERTVTHGARTTERGSSSVGVTSSRRPIVDTGRGTRYTRLDNKGAGAVMHPNRVVLPQHDRSVSESVRVRS